MKSRVIHTYDRGEGNEEYLFASTEEIINPLVITDKNGLGRNVHYDGTISSFADYLMPVDMANLKATTIQDRTFIINKEKTVSIGTRTTPEAVHEAFYWIKRASGDDLHPFRYAVYLDGILFEAIGHESDLATTTLKNNINANVNYSAFSVGNVLRIKRTDGADFTFSSWDSWGDQASQGWKGSVSKLTDLPKELGWEDKYVEITGSDGNSFTTYWVKSTASAWTETRDPFDNRGTLTNMPLAIDRLADGSFSVKRLDWEAPTVGNVDTNPDPSFVGYNLTDVFFYKNRLGLASLDSVVMSETGGYYNFYIKSVLTILDTDPIDVAIASSTASQIQFVKPFQSSLYIFTKESQFEMISLGSTSPTTVSIEVVSNYPMDTNVVPVVNGTSLFFISTSENRRQLREYRKNNDTLVVVGVDLNITTPNLISQDVTGISINGVLGYVFVTTKTNEIYFYAYKESGGTRVQSAWSKWRFYEEDPNAVLDSFEYGIFGSNMWILHKDIVGNAQFSLVNLTKNSLNETLGEALYPSLTTFPSLTLFPGGATFVDLLSSGQFPYTSLIELPKWYPHVANAEFASTKDKILLKKLTIEGTGNFDALLYRYDYATTYIRSHVFTSIRDLDVHINTKVDNCDLIIQDSSTRDFSLTSFILEGLFQQTSKAIR